MLARRSVILATYKDIYQSFFFSKVQFVNYLHCVNLRLCRIW